MTLKFNIRSMYGTWNNQKAQEWKEGNKEGSKVGYKNGKEKKL